jgi:integration host factor subunit alpha
MGHSGTLTRAEIADQLHQEVGLSKVDSAALVEQVLDNISDALVRGENVKLSGFGSFLLRDKKERIGRNPKTGVEVPITPRRVLTFRASQMAREQISKGG